MFLLKFISPIQKKENAYQSILNTYFHENAVVVVPNTIYEKAQK